MKILFLTHEGFNTNIITTQVIKHCESLETNTRKFDIITFELISKATYLSNKNYERYLLSNSQISLKLFFGFYPYLPFNIFINLYLLYKVFRKFKDFDVIHARSDYTTYLCNLLKPFHKLPVIWDCRGDFTDELLLVSQKKSFIIELYTKYVLIPRQYLFIIFNNLFSNHIIYVSSALKRKIDHSYTKCSVIPCQVNHNDFYFDIDLRNDFRNKYQLKKDNIVFLYSGSMVDYQSIDLYLSFFYKLLSFPNYVIFIATNQIDTAKEKFSCFPRSKFIIKSFENNLMNSVLCGSDYGVLLRDNRSLNNVSSPTKFGEYCITGLRVIHNNTIDQVCDITAKISNGYGLLPPYSFCDIKTRTLIATKARQVFSRQISNKKYSSIYNDLLFN